MRRLSIVLLASAVSVFGQTAPSPTAKQEAPKPAPQLSKEQEFHMRAIAAESTAYMLNEKASVAQLHEETLGHQQKLAVERAALIQAINAMHPGWHWIDAKDEPQGGRLESDAKPRQVQQMSVEKSK